MKKHIIILLLSILCGATYAQEPDLMKDMADNYLQLRQKHGSEQQMKEYLKTIKFKSDTIYAIIYAPMNCPRCEAYIRAFHKALKKNSKENELLLISAYPDSVQAKSYNQKNQYIADAYLYDTLHGYERIFSFNTNGLYNTSILKICKSSGRLIIGGDATEISDEFVTQLVAKKDAVECHTFEIQDDLVDNTLTVPVPNVPLMKSKYTDYKIVLDSGYYVSTVYDLPKFENGKFFYTDVLNNGVMLFSADEKEKKLKFRSLIQADSIEKRQFVSVSEEIYQQFINSGSVFYIACGTSMLNNDKIGISYSLPNIFYDVQQDSNVVRIGYRNEATLVARNTKTLERDTLSVFDFELEKSDYFYAHYTFMPYDDNILIGCIKLTWPVEIEAEDYKNDINKNPFCDQFYDTENPFMAVFSRKTGKLIKRFGAMEECQRKSRTGYYYAKSVACTWGDSILYCNGYTGQLYICSKNNLDKSTNHYSAFDIDCTEFPPVDSTMFYTYEYVKPYNKFFTRCIEDVKMNDSKIYCLVRYGMPKDSNDPFDSYSFITIDRKTGKRTEMLLPRYEELSILGYGLKEESGIIAPLIFMKNGHEPFVRVIH
ncbi:MAG: hypothetical protein RR061_09650 [Muribaculaceae bacterium]